MVDEGEGTWRVKLAAWVVVLTLGVLTMSRMGPPPVTPINAPEDAFSAERARSHLEVMAREPRPVGSDAARATEAYLVRYFESLGLRVEVQETPACTMGVGIRRCAHVRNVLATLPGRDAQSAILFSAHYDTVPSAPGAADDGAAVAALLETARALTHAGQLEHDVIFALVDAEEEMLIGASALGRSWPRFANVRLVLNFEARGTRGASVLFAGSHDVGAIIDEISPNVAKPVINSFFWVVGSILPNSTDAEMYEKFGVKTLSFAFAEGLENYHQGTDTLANLDLGSLEHHGQYALAIAKHFANLDLGSLAAHAGDDVFFDLFGAVVVRYSVLAARISGALVMLLIAWLVRRERTSVKAILACFGGFFGFIVAAAIAATLLERAVTWGWSPWSPYVRASWLTASIAVLVLAAFVRVFEAQRKRWGGPAAALGPIVLSMLLGALTLVVAPGASHVFVWPACAAALACLVQRRAPGAAVLFLPPIVVLGSQVIYTGMAVIGGDGVALPAVWIGLIIGLAAPYLLPASRNARPVARGLSIAGFALVTTVSLIGRVSAAPAVGNAMQYALDPPSGRAFWLSSDASNDTWKRQFLGSSPPRGHLLEFVAESSYFYNLAPMPAAPIPAPTVELVGDADMQGQRAITLRVRSTRGARSLALWEATGAKFSDWSFDGATTIPIVRFSPETDEKLFQMVTGIGYDGQWVATFFAVPRDGSFVRFVTTERGALQFRVLDRSSGLAVSVPGQTPRGATFTTAYPGDQTWVAGALLVVPAR